MPADKIVWFLLLKLSDTSADDSYGSDWFVFPTESGGLRFANISLTGMALDTVGRHVYFYLYTSRNKENYEEIYAGNETLNLENFDPENEVKFVTHGWLSSGTSSTAIDIKDAYLLERDYNVIIVDWNDISRDPLYVLAASGTRYVGFQVSTVIQNLMDSYNLTGEQFHLIGHSLGAHVMGYAGRASKVAGQPVRRVTGLDPARPLFEFPPTDGLNWYDAEFVDIIHSSAGVLGYYYSHGDADFYPNGGLPPQPGCEGIEQQKDACSHARSHQYFAESINSQNGFVSNPCGSNSDYKEGKCSCNSTLMGEFVSMDARGDYYLTTNAESEYARGETAKCSE